jgi:hypothetical protein
MLIEEKRHNRFIKLWQMRIFKLLNIICKVDKNFKGFHTLIFENTSPDDGKIYLDNKEIPREYLIKFFKFELDEYWYETLPDLNEI